MPKSKATPQELAFMLERMTPSASREDEWQAMDTPLQSPIMPMDAPTQARFQSEMMGSPWAQAYTKQYGEAPDIGPTANYDYATAWRQGIHPSPDPYDQNRLHWPSRGRGGESLKKAGHPTAWKEEYMQSTGQNPDAVGATLDDLNAMKTRNRTRR